MNIQHCAVCGWEQSDGHDWEIHSAEIRASAHDYGYDRPEYDMDDLGRGTIRCIRCKRWDVLYGIEVRVQYGTLLVICNTCEQPADREEA